MDLIAETSLEALIHKATDARNKELDNASVEAFCSIVEKMPKFAYSATKLLAAKIQSSEEWEAVQALSLLETCMKKCGPQFHTEVGKFRFLNEMIKLLSPKYLGQETSPKVRDLAIRILHSWTIIYTKEPKIKEAFEMLKKQGVVTDDMPALKPEVKAPKPPKKNIPVDPEFENRLKKLLSSKNPEDLEAANRMIKSRVMETERRMTEVERVKTNIRLLADMVNNCHGEIPPEDLQLMSEIHGECERLRPVVFRLAGEISESDVLADLLSLSEELSQVFEKYDVVVKKSKGDVREGSARLGSPSASALLDFSSPVDGGSRSLVPDAAKPISELLGSQSVLSLNSVPASVQDALSLLSSPSLTSSAPTMAADLDQLGAIFGSLNMASSSSSVLPSSSVPLRHTTPPVEKTSKQKAMDELDVLGESLLKKCKDDLQSSSKPEPEKKEAPETDLVNLSGSLDESILGFDDAPIGSETDSSAQAVSMNGSIDTLALTVTSNGSSRSVEKVAEAVVPVKPLTDISVMLEKITPSQVAPLRILESSNGVSILLHLAKDAPRDDVSVFVVTTTSTSSLPLSDYLFQVVVPKSCKFKLQSPSSTSLPAHNPFLPPAAITQILLIANPQAIKVRLTFMLSFTMEEETVTEVGEVAELPSLC